MMNIFEINKRIGQRPPFQMIEKVLELEPNVSARGIKNVSINEPYFMGHFPDAPIMPGVLIIESCAQLCSLVIDDGGKSREEPVFRLGCNGLHLFDLLQSRPQTGCVDIVECILRGSVQFIFYLTQH